ncbi:MAG TPA: hypothetical protein VF170_13135 [Planctomycetaceae bacterium]
MSENASDEPSLSFGPFRFTPTRLAVEGRADAPLEAWAAPLRFSLWCQQGAPWWIGDLLNAGDARFGEMFSQVCEGAVSADQLQRYESVARRVPPENRRPGLSWSAHAAVARLPHALQRKMLDRAEQAGWTSTVLQRKVREEVERRRRSGKPLADDGDDPLLEASPDGVEPYEL